MRVCRAAIVLTISLAACGIREPVIDRGENPPNVGGTISGMVLSAGGNTPLSGRKVTVINTVTGQKLETSTATNGGYTIKVPRGNYRIEVELRPGETFRTKPDDVSIGESDVDAARNFVIAVKPPGF
jgi:hypothetical protein